MVRKVCWLVVLVIGLMSVTCAEAVGIKDHPRLAVMNFANKAIMSEGMRDQDFSSASEYALFQLSASDWFDLIDYEQMAAIAQMHSINMSGLVDASTAPAVGKFAAAQFVMVGALTGMTLKGSGPVVGGVGAKAGITKNTVTANVTVRFVDVETLKIVGVGMGTGKSSSTSAEISFRPYRNIENWIIPRSTNININIGDGNTINNNGVITTADGGDYFVRIGATDVSAVQVRNALGKAVRDAIYGKSGLLTMLNGGKDLKLKTDF